jgi:hypothetical protein
MYNLLIFLFQNVLVWVYLEEKKGFQTCFFLKYIIILQQYLHQNKLSLHKYKFIHQQRYDVPLDVLAY